MKSINLYDEELDLLIELVDDAIHCMLSDTNEVKLAEILLKKLEDQKK